LLLLLLVSCGETQEGELPKETAAPPLPQRVPPPASSPPVTGGLLPSADEAAASQEAQGAATVLETYYALIEARKYREAWELRESGPSAPDEEAFERNFKRYREHHANVGAPSEPVAASGFLFVEVPVHTYGVMKDGRGFGSAGTVTLRRSQAGSNAGKWRIYTSG